MPTERHALWAVESEDKNKILCWGGFDVRSVLDPALWVFNIRMSLVLQDSVY